MSALLFASDPQPINCSEKTLLLKSSSDRSPPFSTASGQQAKAGKPSKKRHSAWSVYGSFVPEFFIDSSYLRSLLSRSGNAGLELAESASLTSPDALFSEEITHKTRRSDSGESNDAATTSPDSGEGSPVQLLTTPAFLPECQLQVKRLFAFMEQHLSRVEGELSARRSPASTPPSYTATTVTGGKGGSGSGRRRLSDSGIEDSSYGALSLLRAVLLRLEHCLRSSFISLEDLVTLHDSQRASDEGEAFLLSQEGKRNQFEHRIASCLADVNSGLDQVGGDGGPDYCCPEARWRANLRAQTKITCLTVCHFCVFVATCVVLMGMPLYSGNPMWYVLLRFARGPMFVVFYLYFLGLNFKGLVHVGVDYIKIFQFPIKGAPTAQFVFNVTGFFACTFALMIAVFMWLNVYTHQVSLELLPLLMWGVVLGFLFNPFKTCLYRGRLAFVFVVVRVLISPLHPVSFGDFWFADQLNSTVAILLDVQYFICYFGYASNWTSSNVNIKVCTTSGNGLRPIISCLPALWRFLQCLRCYKDTRNTRHLINAGKYFTTFPVVVIATVYSVKSSNEVRTGGDFWFIIAWWVLVSFVHSSYTFAWDVYCDWGLARTSHSAAPFLRPKLYYHPLLYYAAIGTDFILRFLWTFKLTLAIVWNQYTDIVYTVLVAGEILRRIQWNFFRVEYEQIVLAESKGGENKV